MTQIRCYETTRRPVFTTIVLHRRIPYLKNLVGQVAPQALPDAYETSKFLSRLDWPLSEQGGDYINLHHHFFLIKLITLETSDGADT